jgi:LSD1 subclass zinc finger protein
MASSPFQKIACPSCGAPLLFGAGETSTRCQFCHAVIERPQPERLRTETERRKTPPSVQLAPFVPTKSPQPAAISPAVIGFLFIGGFVLAIAVILWLAFGAGSPDTFLKPTLIVNGPIALLPAEDSQPPDFIAMGYDIIAENNPIARLSPANHSIVWRGPVFEEISDVRAIAAGGGSFFAAEGAHLHAYNDADGSALWQADLTDQVGYCAECLSVRDDRVIVLTQDYILQAFDTATGETAWQRRLAGYTSGFSLLSDSLLVIDKEEEDYSLFVLNLSDGSVRRRITPECMGANSSYAEQLDSNSTVVLEPDPSGSPDAGSLYLIYGWSPGCIERRDISTGEMKWQHLDERGFSPSGDLSALVTADTFFFAADNNLWAANAADGKTRLVTQAQDYELVPLTLAGDTLIVRTKRTRGSTQFGLWGMDPAYGEKEWQYTFEKSEPIDPPDEAAGLVDSDQSAWTWRITDGAIRVVDFQADPNRVVLYTLDPTSGGVSNQKEIALQVDSDFYSVPEIIAWQDPVVWVEVDSEILGIDIVAGSVKYSYP